MNTCGMECPRWCVSRCLGWNASVLVMSVGEPWVGMQQCAPVMSVGELGFERNIA